MKKLFSLLILTMSMGAYIHAQLPSKLSKLIGTWEYKEGSGFEMWKMDNDELIGSAFRVNGKTGDTSKVEEMSIRKPSRNLLYAIETYNYVEGNLIVRRQNFIADRRKMKFFNMDNQTPYAIEYSFGIFSKKKLKVKIYHGPYDKPLKLILYKR